MPSIRFQRTQSLFEAALALPSTEREPYLRRKAADDPELVVEVLELLAHYKMGDDSLLQLGVAQEVSSTSGSDAADPDYVGPYRVLDRLGEGGMGVVYLAEQTQPVRRQVALKLIKAGMDTKSVLARFERERQALAMMDHDGIAKVFDCGADDAGRPYFVMELVRGVPIDTYCDVHKLPLAERLWLLQRACESVQHAHHKGVVHRDVKPSNILVLDTGSGRQVKVIDFGLAKVLDEDLAEASCATMQGRLLGTPEFMAPEQASEQSCDVDTRADVYSLGCVLYELLVGHLPHEFEKLRGQGIEALRRVICDQDSPRPSDRLARSGAAAASVAAARDTSLAGLLKILRSDLDWVVGKALEKDRERRYPSASALSDDLQRFLDHDPVVAGPPSKVYRIRKLARRYRTQLTVAATVLLTALIGGTVATWNAIEANAAKSEVTDTLQDYELLASVVQTRKAIARSDELWITWPDRVSELGAWLEHDAADALRMQPELDKAITRLAASASSESPSSRSALSKGFLHQTLVDARGDMRQLADESVATMQRRQYWAHQQWQLSLHHPNSRHSWEEVRAAIATNPHYADANIELTDADVVGLVPLGENPVTHYWEFYDLRSAWDGHTDPGLIEIPKHREDGSIHVREVTGMVFVLLPGGEYVVGPADEQAIDGAKPTDNTDTLPSHQVMLQPFFCARHEMTRAQWWRLTNTAPSYYQYAVSNYKNREVLDDYPVERVSWRMATRALASIGCALPTEAQWEHACRGGTRTAWWSGAEPSSLQGCTNISDQTLARTQGVQGLLAPIEDGYTLLAPVGSFKPNGFGLFDTHGNAIEWCANDYENPALAQADIREDDLSVVPKFLPVRGGAFNSTTSETRCAKRDYLAADFSNPVTGLRATRLARHPWRDRLSVIDAAVLSNGGKDTGTWWPGDQPRVVPGRWRSVHGTSQAEPWEEQINISETGQFIVNYGKRNGATGTFTQAEGVAIFESAHYVERWTAAGDTWDMEVWSTKQAMIDGRPAEDVGTAEWLFSVPYIATGK